MKKLSCLRILVVVAMIVFARSSLQVQAAGKAKTKKMTKEEIQEAMNKAMSSLTEEQLKGGEEDPFAEIDEDEEDSNEFDVDGEDEEDDDNAPKGRQSQFNRKIDFNKLEEEYNTEKEDEDMGWHEDTYEWREKKLKQKGEGDIDEMDVAALLGQVNTGNQMMFVLLKEDKYPRDGPKSEAEQLAIRWTEMLKTGGIIANPYATESYMIIFTNHAGQSILIKDFLIDQPEVEKFTWNEVDYFPRTEKEKEELEKVKEEEEIKYLRRRKQKRLKEEKKK